MMATKKRTLRPSELLRVARAQAFDGVSHPSVFLVLDAKGRALRVQPARLTDDEIALQAIANLRSLAADTPRGVAELLDDQSDEDTPPVSPQDRVRETIGALKVRARVAEKGRRRSMDARSRAFIVKLDSTDQFGTWRTERLSTAYLDAMLRYLRLQVSAMGWTNPHESLRRMLNRARRKVI